MSGDIPNRTTLLNFLVEKYNLKRYLELGVQNTSQNFDKIKCAYKVGVDPDPMARATQCRTSDDFFKYTQDHIMINPLGTFQPFDLVFIDGLHTAEQVKKDFENALKILTPNGFICLHDCNPEKEEHTIVPRPTERGHWNGDVYRFALTITSTPFTNERAFTVDIDNGITVFSSDLVYRDNELPIIEWSNFARHRRELLNLISWDEFVAIGS